MNEISSIVPLSDALGEGVRACLPYPAAVLRAPESGRQFAIADAAGRSEFMRRIACDPLTNATYGMAMAHVQATAGGIFSQIEAMEADAARMIAAEIRRWRFFETQSQGMPFPLEERAIRQTPSFRTAFRYARRDAEVRTGSALHALGRSAGNEALIRAAQAQIDEANASTCHFPLAETYRHVWEDVRNAWLDQNREYSHSDSGAVSYR